MTDLSWMAAKYVDLRSKADKMVAENDARSRSSHSHDIGGLTHHTPEEVVNAVAAYKNAAIELAEYVARTTL